MSDFLEKAIVGAKGCTTLGHIYTIISRNPNRHRWYRVRFESGYEVDVYSSNLYRGTIVDRYQKTYLGWGILGDPRGEGDPHYKKIYLHWAHMIKRCVDKNSKYYHNYGGAGVTIAKRWQRFDNFYDDFRKIEGYSEELMSIKSDRHLDKDIKQAHLPYKDRVYSLETCKLVTRKENRKFSREFERPYIMAINPAGTAFYINHQQKFRAAIKQKINSKYMHKCIIGEKTNHSGWMFFKITEDIYNKFHEANPLSPEYPQEQDLVFEHNSVRLSKQLLGYEFNPDLHKANYDQYIV